MYDTHVTVVGNALHTPEWRKTANTGAMVATFKIASTARRLSKETGQWIDGNSLRVRVTCWRGLAYNVKESVTVGDPLIVTGRLYTRDWEDEKGIKRTQYELEATSVGHDLSRGRAVFERHKTSMSTSAVEDAEAQQRIGGELTEPVPDHEAPSEFNDTPFEEAAADRAAQARSLGLAPSSVPSPAPASLDPVGALRVGGFTTEPVSPPAAYRPVTDPDALSRDGLSPDALSPVIEDEPEPADPGEPDPLDDAIEPVPALVGEPGEAIEERGSGRRRGLRRSKVPS